MEYLHKSKLAVITITLFVFIYASINILSNGFFNQTITVNEQSYSYNLDNQKISVFVGGAVDNSGWFECSASTTYKQLFIMAEVISAANISAFNLSNKLNDYDENFQKIIIIESDFESAFNINTVDEAQMLIEGISYDIINSIVTARESGYLNFKNLVLDGVLTSTQFSKCKYRFYSL